MSEGDQLVLVTTKVKASVPKLIGEECLLLTFTWCLLCSGHRSKGFMRSSSFNLHNNFMRVDVCINYCFIDKETGVGS